MNLSITIFNVLFPIMLIAAIGYWYAKRSSNAYMQFINNANMDIFAPALIFSALTQSSWSLQENIALMAGAFSIVLGVGLLTLPLCKILNIDRRVLLPPTMFNNSANLGVPLLVFSFGADILPQAILLYVCSSILHFSLGLAIVNPSANILKQLTRPALVAAFLAILFNVMQWRLPLALDRSIDLMGQIAIPLMIFALGTKLTDIPKFNFRTPILAGAWIPLSGLLVAILYIYLVPVSDSQKNLLLIFSLLPPAVFNFLVAERYLENEEMKGQVAELVLWGNVLCIVPIAMMLAWIFSR